MRVPGPVSEGPGIGFDAARAARWGGRLARPGPTGSRAELSGLVADLREAADFSHAVAVRASRLGPLLRAAGHVPSGSYTSVPRAEVLVVDRPGWAGAAAATFAEMLGEPGSGEGGAAGRGAAGAPADATDATAELAGLLALLAPRVLGQYDPYGDRLLLVAPNLLHLQRSLGDAVPARDLHRWVAVHELTHALQFRAAPWLADHLRAESRAVLAAGAAGDELGAIVSGLARAAREGRLREPDFSLLDTLLDDDARDRVDRLTALMAVLEGHADVSMDLVGRAIIGTTPVLRARLERRRRSPGRAEGLVRRLMGLDAKLAQYRDGAAFVRAVRKQAGWRALDPVFAELATMPTPAEIADPAAWVRRVHG